MSIQVEQLSFAYGSIPVLDDVSIHMEPGRLICVLGENGAGKSTLFRCILNILSTYSGHIYIEDRDIRQLSGRELAKRIAYVPQHHEAQHHYSVEQMVLMGTCAALPFWGNPGREQEQEAGRAMEMIGIGHLRAREFARLSGGERQMVLIARAIAQQAGIIVMDEPCASLDYGNQVRIMELLTDLAGKGYLILQSTHNPDHALLYADEVIALKQGRVLCQGEPGRELTEAVIAELYGVSVSLTAVGGSGKKICIPKSINIQRSEG